MNDIARRLRAQKVFSTDPAYLERMARELEVQAAVGNDQKSGDHCAQAPAAPTSISRGADRHLQLTVSPVSTERVATGATRLESNTNVE